MASLQLPVRGPFSLAASSGFLEGFPSAGYRGSTDDEILRLAFPMAGTGAVVGVSVRQEPDGAVLADVDGDVPDGLAAQVARILSLDVDGSGYPDVRRIDPVVDALADRYPGLRPVCFLLAVRGRLLGGPRAAHQHGLGRRREGPHRPPSWRIVAGGRSRGVGLSVRPPAACRRRRTARAGGQAGAPARGRRGHDGRPPRRGPIARAPG